jgi:hypothetical protein
MAFHEVVFLTEGAKEQEKKGKVRNFWYIGYIGSQRKKLLAKLRVN